MQEQVDKIVKALMWYNTQSSGLGGLHSDAIKLLNLLNCSIALCGVLVSYIG
jgi:hypothetical protein